MSKPSPGETPPQGQAVTLRTVLPQASREVTPTSPSRSSAASEPRAVTKWSCRFCRVLMWPKPRDQRSVTAASASSCSALTTPWGSLVRTM